MSDVIWALDTRDRVIACPSKPVANAVVLYLADDGGLNRARVAEWADAGVMVASVTWPGVNAHLSEDDIMDLEDAADGLSDLASVVGVVAEPGALDVLHPIYDGRDFAYLGVASLEEALPILKAAAPV